MNILALVVATCLDRLRAKNLIEFMALWVLVRPLSDGIEHVAVDLAGLLTETWVVESAEYVFNDLGDWDTWVFPSEEHASARG